MIGLFAGDQHPYFEVAGVVGDKIPDVVHHPNDLLCRLVGDSRHPQPSPDVRQPEMRDQLEFPYNHVWAFDVSDGDLHRHMVARWGGKGQ